VTFEQIKLIHLSCALISIAGFTLRGYWMYAFNPLLRHPLTRVLPHCIDTLLLGSGIAMLYLWGRSPLEFPWLVAKLLGLLLYIGLGMVALRFGRTRRVRVGAWLLAVMTGLYILAVAYAKSPAGPLRLLGLA